MSHVQGAVVVRRPDLAQEIGRLTPARGLDFVETLQSYFPTSRGSLLRYAVCLLFREETVSNATISAPFPVPVAHRYQTGARASKLAKAWSSRPCPRDLLELGAPNRILIFCAHQLRSTRSVHEV